MLLLVITLVGDVPTTHNAPACSLDAKVKAAHPESFVVSDLVDGGNNKRCIAVVVPSLAAASPNSKPAILFDFHGAGKNASKYGAHNDTLGSSWADLASKYGFVVVAGEALQWNESFRLEDGAAARAWPWPTGWHGGQWLIPEVQTDDTGIVCDWQSDSPEHGAWELTYIAAALDELGSRGFDTTRVFFTGCSMGSALTGWLAQCYHRKLPGSITAFNTQSTGLKVQGDGLVLPPDNYDTHYSWGECPGCQYFPAPVTVASGLKACVVDQTGDGDFFNSSLALSAAWQVAGMRSELSITAGGHCDTRSYEWIATCLDDGTGRLLGAINETRMNRSDEQR